jgi:hypothetical protein
MEDYVERQRALIKQDRVEFESQLLNKPSQDEFV